MIKKMDKTCRFFLISILFTWILWIISMTLSIVYYTTIPYNENMVVVFINGYDSSLQLILNIIFSLAVYGPLVGYLVMIYIYKEKNKIKFFLPDYKWLLAVMTYSIVVFLIAAIVGGANFKVGISLTWLPLLLLIQLVTSGTEEFGWRHYLQPILVSKHGQIKAFYMIGIMWSLWHFPFIIFLNYQAGLFATMLSLIGFTFLTIPQAFVAGYLYDKTKNILLLVFFHAWTNVMSYYILGLSTNVLMTTTVVAIITWLVAQLVENEYKKEQVK